MLSLNRKKQENPPGREAEPGRGALLFTVIAGGVSVLFMVYGVSILAFEESSLWLVAFGCVTAGYGLLSLIVLWLAHRSRALRCVTASQVLAVCYLGAYALALSADLEIGLGLGGILLVAFALWSNWVAVTKVIKQGA